LIVKNPRFPGRRIMAPPPAGGWTATVDGDAPQPMIGPGASRMNIKEIRRIAEMAPDE
jgi:hypothetical protein